MKFTPLLLCAICAVALMASNARAGSFAIDIPEGLNLRIEGNTIIELDLSRASLCFVEFGTGAAEKFAFLRIECESDRLLLETESPQTSKPETIAFLRGTFYRVMRGLRREDYHLAGPCQKTIPDMVDSEYLHTDAPQRTLCTFASAYMLGR